MGKRILGWFRRDTVLTISLCLAVSSCLIEPPGPGYLSYIDCNTLITLFCLMLLVEGLREEQFLQYAAARVLSRVRTMAERNIDTLDAGVPVLSMHSPFETVGKLDCYMTFKGVKAIYEAK